jgi:hypothetical protein
MIRFGSLILGSAVAAALTVTVAGAGPAEPPLECKGTIKPVETLPLPHAPAPREKPAGLPDGKCSQIVITAWRTTSDYSATEPLTPHEKTAAMGKSLAQCTYSLHVQSSVMVKFVATTTIPDWMVTLSYRPSSSSTDPMIWEEKHPVVINWHLRPKTGLATIKLPILSPPQNKAKPTPSKHPLAR